jgi:hypothetical protein
VIFHLALIGFLNLSFQVEVGFADGSAFNLSAEFLRVHSPAVDGKIRSIGGEKVIVRTVFHLCTFKRFVISRLTRKREKNCCSSIGLSRCYRIFP